MAFPGVRVATLSRKRPRSPRRALGISRSPPLPPHLTTVVGTLLTTRQRWNRDRVPLRSPPFTGSKLEKRPWTLSARENLVPVYRNLLKLSGHRARTLKLRMEKELEPIIFPQTEVTRHRGKLRVTEARSAETRGTYRTPLRTRREEVGCSGPFV